MNIFRFILSIPALVVISFSCKKENASAMADAPPVQVSAQKTFLALGDSYTTGQSVQASQRFPEQTKQWLKNEGIDIADPKYVAVTGFTTYDLSAAIRATELQNSY